MTQSAPLPKVTDVITRRVVCAEAISLSHVEVASLLQGSINDKRAVECHCRWPLKGCLKSKSKTSKVERMALQGPKTPLLQVVCPGNHFVETWEACPALTAAMTDFANSFDETNACAGGYQT